MILGKCTAVFARRNGVQFVFSSDMPEGDQSTGEPPFTTVKAQPRESMYNRV